MSDTYTVELFVCEHRGPGTSSTEGCKRSFYREPGSPAPKCDRMGHDLMVSAGVYELPEEQK